MPTRKARPNPQPPDAPANPETQWWTSCPHYKPKPNGQPGCMFILPPILFGDPPCSGCRRYSGIEEK